MDHQTHRTKHNDHLHHQRSASHGQHRVLDLDAEVFGDNLAAVLGLTGVPAARSVVDLGAGTGAGSRLLRERYPDAAVTCIDSVQTLADIIDKCNCDRIAGICIDTCHAFSSGYDLTMDEGIEKLFSEIKEYIGIDKLKLIHLNDSRRGLWVQESTGMNISVMDI